MLYVVHTHHRSLVVINAVVTMIDMNILKISRKRKEATGVYR